MATDDREALAALLSDHGYDPSTADILADDGMGPRELAVRLAHEPETLRSFGYVDFREPLPPAPRVGCDVRREAERLESADPDRETLRPRRVP